MTIAKAIMAAGLGLILSGCSENLIQNIHPAVGENKTHDKGFDKKHLSELKAGIWVDPNGCDHWIIDDGVEGYLSARLDRKGKPVCSGVAPPTTAVGPYKAGGRKQGDAF